MFRESDDLQVIFLGNLSICRSHYSQRHNAPKIRLARRSGFYDLQVIVWLANEVPILKAALYFRSAAKASASRFNSAGVAACV
jgi:hypothetical protein